MFHYLKSHQRKLFRDKVKLKILALLIIFNLLSIIYYPLSISSAFASNEFGVNQIITYNFGEKGDCQTTYEITLENKLSNIYATQYSITISGERIQNIAVKDGQGKDLKVDVNQSQRQLTKVIVYPNSPVTGKGEKQTFVISYLGPDYAQKEGQIWRITTPKINNLEEADNLDIFIKAPFAFGKLSFISPQGYQYHQEEKQVIQFSKKALQQGEIMIIFGKSQTFEFTLKYYLKNSQEKKERYLLALPPDTNYQKIYLNQIIPQPENVVSDEDGNWLATFDLSPQQEINVIVQGQAQIASEPISLPFLPKNLENYLQDQTYWEKNDPEIQEIAQELKTPQKINQFVIQKLEYNLGRIENNSIKRLGAKGALAQPQNAICTEFTDLFIALCRAAGIPAREINGYAYSDNPQLLPLSLKTDILHSWPEFWDEEKKVWRQVDPTWENTSHINYFDKMDMAHLTLVIHGQDNQKPAPAGAYRQSSSQEKNVLVNFSSPQEKTVSEPQIILSLPQKILPKQKIKGSLNIFNPGPVALYHQKITIRGEKISLEEITENEIAVLPPFGQKNINFILSSQTNILKDKEVIVETYLGEENNLIKIQKTSSIQLAPIILQEKSLKILMGSAALLFSLLLFLAVKKIRKN